MHAVTDRSMTLDRELYGFEKQDALRVARVVVEMIRNGRIEDAISLARAGVNLSPRSGETWNTLAYAYSHAPGMEREQTAAAREAVLQGPEDPSAWHNLSLGLMKCFDFDGALEANGRAMALPSDNAFYPLHGAFLASLTGNHERSLSMLEWARDRVLAGDHPERLRFLAEIDIQAAIAHASMGDWWNFCKLLESRHELSTETREGGGPTFLKRMWELGRLWNQTGQWKVDDHDEALVYLEWGIGDQIQFARLIPKALKLIVGAQHVTVACSAPLMDLIRTVPGVDQVIDHRDPGLTPENVRPEVAVIPVIDLMAELHRYGMFPLGSFDGAYIPRPAVKTFLPTMRQAEKIAIAFSWQGDPKQTQDFNRRIPFRAWAEFAKSQRTFGRYTFHSVQTKFGGHIDPWEGWPAEVPLEDCGPLIRDMRDVAEVISKCDVFVGQCGANLHLAGAMGKPAVAMLGFAHDFRWDFEPLYGCELVKQARPGDWGSAFAQLDVAIDRAVSTAGPADFQKEK